MDTLHGCVGFSRPVPAERRSEVLSVSFFFFQAEDGIRYLTVTGVQTCALPISGAAPGQQGISDRWYHDGKPTSLSVGPGGSVTITDENGITTSGHMMNASEFKIGRASCRERV